MDFIDKYGFYKHRRGWKPSQGKERITIPKTKGVQGLMCINPEVEDNICETNSKLEMKMSQRYVHWEKNVFGKLGN